MRAAWLASCVAAASCTAPRYFYCHGDDSCDGICTTSGSCANREACPPYGYRYSDTAERQGCVTDRDELVASQWPIDRDLADTGPNHHDLQVWRRVVGSCNQAGFCDAPETADIDDDGALVSMDGCDPQLEACRYVGTPELDGSAFPVEGALTFRVALVQEGPIPPPTPSLFDAFTEPRQQIFAGIQASPGSSDFFFVAGASTDVDSTSAMFTHSQSDPYVGSHRIALGWTTQDIELVVDGLEVMVPTPASWNGPREQKFMFLFGVDGRVKDIALFRAGLSHADLVDLTTAP